MAFTVLSRIEDVIYADYLVQNPSQGTCKRNKLRASTGVMSKKLNPMEEMEKLNMVDAGSMTLLDFMGWNLDQEDKKDSTGMPGDDSATDANGKLTEKLPVVTTNKKVSYIEKIENLGGSRSPTARH